MGWVVVEQEKPYGFLVMDKLCIGTRAIRFGVHRGRGGAGRRVACPKGQKGSEEGAGNRYGTKCFHKMSWTNS